MIHPFGIASSLVGLLGSYIHEERDYKSTSGDQKLIAALRRDIKKLPKISPKKSLALSAWDQNRLELRQHILSDNPFSFLRWLVVQRTMVADCNIVEFTFLLFHNFSAWQPFLRESNVGMGKKYTFYPASSFNLLHTAYNLRQIIKLPAWARELDNVVEFGGGYGCMCNLLYRCGFSGTYTLFDLPEFSSLQRFYLRKLMPQKMLKKISFIADSKIKKTNPTLLIGTWSLSETATITREKFLKKINPSMYFIAYQEKFGEVNNLKYFKQFRKSHPQYIWFDYPIYHIPGSRYVIGVKKSLESPIAERIIAYISERHALSSQ